MRGLHWCNSGLLGACLMGVVLVALSGCSTATPDEDWHAIANGVDGDVGGVEVRSLLIVSEDANQPGRFLGTLFNSSTEPVDVVLSDQDDSVTVRVEAQGEVGFDTNPLVLSSVSDIPGSRVSISVTAGGEKEEFSTPVLDGTLQAYRPFLPSAAASASPSAQN
ncbi:hypothetical protein ACFVYC_21335 [Pseudarthrobacter sp. NPDC058329]|uniref:hypothetical protein n=1 Tax=Pseudarthrobacter sp. NPDC058329 TaxID=3346448 RepID=UPI0036D7D0EE